MGIFHPDGADGGFSSGTRYGQRAVVEFMAGTLSPKPKS
jgi:hypothetical protein